MNINDYAKMEMDLLYTETMNSYQKVIKRIIRSEAHMMKNISAKINKWIASI